MPSDWFLRMARALCVWLSVFGSMSVAGSTPDPDGVGLTPHALRCEYLHDPASINTTRPRLSWQLASERAGAGQSAYQVRAAGSLQALVEGGDLLWDTGRVVSDQTLFVEYTGRPLGSRDRVVWQVRVWDEQGGVSAWSAPARFGVGLLESGDWSAQWISIQDDASFDVTHEQLHLPPARYYRKAFGVDRPVRRATAYVSAMGIYDLHLNGERVSGDLAFLPGWADYAQRVFYTTFDLTDRLNEGEHAIGAVLADGWYAGYLGYGLLKKLGPNGSGRSFYGKTPALLVQLEIEFEDGTAARIITDGSWRVSDGAFVHADMLMGETYDARKHPAGWDTDGFDDSGWDAVVLAKDNPESKANFRGPDRRGVMRLNFQTPPVIEAHPGVPVKEIEVLDAVSVTERPDGTYIIDFGQNMSGVVRMAVRGEAGTAVTLRHGEMLHPDGRLMTENLRKARAVDTFILDGSGREVFQPRFTYHGFQYIEVVGYPGVPKAEDFQAVVLHSDTPLTSTFECSDPMLNQLFSNTVWTQRSNFFEVPTDCPQRDERLGWMGDAQVYAKTATYHADIGAFMTKWMQDIRDAQTDAGAYPDYAPFPMQLARNAYGTAWMDAGVIVPWVMHQAYGDTRILEAHYDSMKRFMDFRMARSPDAVGVATGNTWGDWLAVGTKSPIEFVDHCYYAYSAKLMADIAGTLGKDEDQAAYEALFERIRKTFAQNYVNDDGTLTVDTQTAYVLAISTGIIADDLRQAASDKLAQMIRDNDTRMTTGFLGTRSILSALSTTGHSELAVQLLQSRRFPSWGYPVSNGATTIWERWDSYTNEDGFGRHNAGMNSFSHYAFGAVMEWIFGDLAGIKPMTPGYGRILIAPMIPLTPPRDGTPVLDEVNATYQSIRGPIAVHWQREGARLTIDFEVPANTSAQVVLPAAGMEDVQRPDVVETVSFEAGRAVLEAPAGRHRIVVSRIAE